MNTILLHYFLVLAKELHFGNAARKLSLLDSTISLIFPFVKKLVVKSPQINLRMSQYTTKEQLDMVLAGNVDTAFLRGSVHSFGLPLKHFMQESFVLVYAKKYQNEIIDGNILLSLSKKPFIAFSRELGERLFDTIIPLCHDQNIIPNIPHTATNMNNLIYMVEEDMGFSIIPKSCAKSNGDGLSAVDLEHLPFHSTICYYYNHENNNPVLHNFLTLLQQQGMKR